MKIVCIHSFDDSVTVGKIYDAKANDQGIMEFRDDKRNPHLLSADGAYLSVLDGDKRVATFDRTEG